MNIYAYKIKSFIHLSRLLPHHCPLLFSLLTYRSAGEAAPALPKQRLQERLRVLPPARPRHLPRERHQLCRGSGSSSSRGCGRKLGRGTSRGSGARFAEAAVPGAADGVAASSVEAAVESRGIQGCRRYHILRP